jgi:hypothetical protein
MSARMTLGFGPSILARALPRGLGALATLGMSAAACAPLAGIEDVAYLAGDAGNARDAEAVDAVDAGRAADGPASDRQAGADQDATAPQDDGSDDASQPLDTGVSADVQSDAPSGSPCAHNAQCQSGCCCNFSPSSQCDVAWSCGGQGFSCTL